MTDTVASPFQPFKVNPEPDPTGAVIVHSHLPETAGRFLVCRVFAFEQYQREDGQWMHRMLPADAETMAVAEDIAEELNSMADADRTVAELKPLLTRLTGANS